MKTAAFAPLLLMALAVSACGKDAATPTSATTTSVPSTRLFAGTLAVNGSAFFSFTASQSGTASATLASVTAGATGRTLSVPLGLGIGIPEGFDCSLLSSTTATPALVPQLTYLPAAATYCVRVYDTGALTSDVAFAVRITYP